MFLLEVKYKNHKLKISEANGNNVGIKYESSQVKDIVSCFIDKVDEEKEKSED